MDIKAISCRLSSELGQEVELDQVLDAEFKAKVSDATIKFHVRIADRAYGYLLVSGPGNPYLVNRAVRNIRDVNARVSSHVSSHILEPILVADEENISYALWLEKRQFLSGNRLINLLRRRHYARRIIEWSESLTYETLKQGDPVTFLADLQNIHSELKFPKLMREDAIVAETRIVSKLWQPMHCIQHGDFWSGNVLLPLNGREPSFYIIDWAGMHDESYPFLDLSRMLMSLRSNPRFCASRIDGLRNKIGCEEVDVISYTLCALGHIGRNLEHFPLDRFQKMAVQVYNFIKQRQAL